MLKRGERKLGEFLVDFSDMEVKWRMERKNARVWERLKAEIERLDVDERVKTELLKAIDELHSEARKKGFAIKVVKLKE